MFDINTISKRYFDIKLTVTDNKGQEQVVKLEVEPPKVKALKKIVELSKAKDEDAIEDLTQAIKMILSKNRTKYAVPDEAIDELDLDQMNQILTAYFKWLMEEKKNPN